MEHAARATDLSMRFADAMTRFVAQVEHAPADAAGRPPAHGGWSVAQIAWHLGTINNAFADLIDGTIPNARPAPDGYLEMPWGALIASVPDKLEAPERFRPPAVVSRDAAISLLKASSDRLTGALATLTLERGHLTVKSILGLITVYQVGEWAIAHVYRHAEQAGRALDI